MSNDRNTSTQTTPQARKAPTDYKVRITQTREKDERVLVPGVVEPMTVRKGEVYAAVGYGPHVLHALVNAGCAEWVGPPMPESKPVVFAKIPDAVVKHQRAQSRASIEGLPDADTDL